MMGLGLREFSVCDLSSLFGMHAFLLFGRTDQARSQVQPSQTAVVNNHLPPSRKHPTRSFPHPDSSGPSQ